MKQDVEEYVHTCLICQQDKTNTRMRARIVATFTDSERPWMSVSMDFITQLLMVQGYNEILVMVDRFSKYVVFIVTKMPCSVEEVKLFFKHIVKYWGLPLNIVSDRDARFTSKFWTTLFKLVGMKLLKSSSYHPQTDGKTE
jgi:hypothetical protein